MAAVEGTERAPGPSAALAPMIFIPGVWQGVVHAVAVEVTTGGAQTFLGVVDVWLRIAERDRADAVALHLDALRVIAWLELGEVARAREQLEQVRVRAELARSPGWRGVAEAFRGYVAVTSGDLTTAVEQVATADAALAPVAHLQTGNAAVHLARYAQANTLARLGLVGDAYLHYAPTRRLDTTQVALLPLWERVYLTARLRALVFSQVQLLLHQEFAGELEAVAVTARRIGELAVRAGLFGRTWDRHDLVELQDAALAIAGDRLGLGCLRSVPEEVPVALLAAGRRARPHPRRWQEWPLHQLARGEAALARGDLAVCRDSAEQLLTWALPRQDQTWAVAAAGLLAAVDDAEAGPARQGPGAWNADEGLPDAATVVADAWESVVRTCFARVRAERGARRMDVQTRRERLALAADGARTQWDLHHDSLTGLANRQFVLDHLAAHPVRGALFIDLDRFKTINDTCGHAAGDGVLVRLARVLAETVRGRDQLARYGGDEFIVLVEDPGDLLGLGERIVAAVAATRFDDLVDDLPVTVSVAAARTRPGEAAHGRDLIALSDANMLRAKRDGRNRMAG